MDDESVHSPPDLLVELTKMLDKSGPIVEKLKKSYEKLQWVTSILENALDGVVIINHQSEIVFVNKSAERIFGYTVSEMLGEELSLILPARFKLIHHRFVEKAITDKETLAVKRIVPCVRNDGMEIRVEITLSETPDSLYFIGVVREQSDYVQEIL